MWARSQSTFYFTSSQATTTVAMIRLWPWYRPCGARRCFPRGLTAVIYYYMHTSEKCQVNKTIGQLSRSYMFLSHLKSTPKKKGKEHKSQNTNLANFKPCNLDRGRDFFAVWDFLPHFGLCVSARKPHLPIEHNVKLTLLPFYPASVVVFLRCTRSIKLAQSY